MTDNAIDSSFTMNFQTCLFQFEPAFSRAVHAAQGVQHGRRVGHCLGVLAMVSLLAACAADRGFRASPVEDVIRSEIAHVVKPAPTAPVVPARISDVLAQPSAPKAPAEPRIDLLVNNASARDVFLALVADTRYSMLMHPDVQGTLSVTLRSVTVLEALEAIRDVYGYDFKIDARRITVYAPTIQTRIFTVDYPHSLRVGTSNLRVTSGSSQSSNGNSGNNSSSTSTGSGNAGSSGSSSQQTESSRVSTTSSTDYWAELTEAIKGLVGTGTGRSVITSPQAGIIAVRAMPEELRQVDKFLSAAKQSVERQVMLEAKIVEVELRDGFQSGIDWSALRNVTKSTGAMGTLGGGAANVLVGGTLNNLPGFPASGNSLLVDSVSLPPAGGGLFGLAFATDGFQAVLGFLETRGDVQILSSPRIATLNNQKAVFKVGTDDYFVTNMTSSNTTTQSTSTGTSNNNNGNLSAFPTVSLASFFSGIALDVTPQIDGANNITLHVHPSVTTVTEKSKQIDLGSLGNFRLPLASSSVNESDTMVRLQDGNIVAIGGLMQIQSNRSASGVPGATDVSLLGTLLGNRANTGRKKELVVLIKPSIIRTAADWEQQTRKARTALDDIDAARNRVIRLDGTVDEARPNPSAK